MAGSRARAFAENFRLSSANYWKAVALLKARFERDLLVEVYVGEILKMINSPHHAKEAINFSSIYDKLKWNLWTLETLGVTSKT